MIEANIANGLPEFEEIYLPQAPLVVVLAQVTFEKLLDIQDLVKIAPFQNVIRQNYPQFSQLQRHSTTVNPMLNFANFTKEPVWRFSDSKNSWQVTLNSDSIALETRAYTSRTDFLSRFESVLHSFEACFKPTLSTRIGVRYIDRIEGAAIRNIQQLVKPELIGFASTNLEECLEANISEALFKFGTSKVFARYGRMPPMVTTDPILIPPSKDLSWLLDIDSSKTETAQWSQPAIAQTVTELAKLSYRFFRWTTTNEFLTFYGGKL